MRLQSHAQDMVNRARMNHLNDERRCLFLKPLSKMFAGGVEIGPFEQGQEVYLANWIIEILIADEIVEILPEDEFEAMSHLQRIYQQERKQSRIQEINPLLFAAIREKVQRLQGDKTSPDPIGQQDIGKLEDLLRNMIEIRLSKIIQVAKSGAYQDTQKQMTQEERWLCEEIIEILSEWRHYVREES